MNVTCCFIFFPSIFWYLLDQTIHQLIKKINGRLIYNRNNSWLNPCLELKPCCFTVNVTHPFVHFCFFVLFCNIPNDRPSTVINPTFHLEFMVITHHTHRLVNTHTHTTNRETRLGPDSPSLLRQMSDCSCFSRPEISTLMRIKWKRQR